ncbi:MAG: Ig-like domain-containing protein [Myxococcota bacterium]|nr:Ig-like domain-containing protein [Myxococcota bacterium]
MDKSFTSSQMGRWPMVFLLTVVLGATAVSQLGCAEATADSNASEDGCECGEFAGECVPCADAGPLMLPPPGSDAGTFLNQGNIDKLNELFLNQEGNGPQRIYVNEAGPENEVGVRVVNAEYGTPAPNIPVNFQIVEVNPNQPSGAALLATSVMSNQFGVAKIAIQGGPRPAFFKLAVSSPQANNALTYDVNVVQRAQLSPPPVNPDKPPPVNMQTCLKTKGIFDVTNRYQPASILGDSFNQTLMTIARVINDPGSLVADLIRNNLGGVAGRIAGGIIRSVVNNLVRIQLQRLPDWAQATIQITGDLATNLTDLEIRATMQLGEINPMTCQLRGTHRWNELTFIWTRNCAPNDMNCGRFDVPLRELGVSLSETDFLATVEVMPGFSDKLYIEEHTLQMNIAVAVLWFIERFLLPQYFQGANSFGDLIARLIPCDALAGLVLNQIGGGLGGIFGGLAGLDDLLADACREAISSAGDSLARDLIDDLNVDTFAMSGECDFRDNDGNGYYDRMQNGVWNGELQGTFTGERSMGMMAMP